MSIFTELLPKINQISQDFTNTFNENLKEALECFDKFEADFENVKRQAREKFIKEKTVLSKLQSINEDDGERSKTPDEKSEQKVLAKPAESSEETEKEDAPPIRGPKKRSKHEVDDMSSPEVDKRQKRNASVVAKNIISKQAKENMNVLKENIIETVEKLVNVNLTQKLRREDSGEKAQTKTKKNKDENKENAEPPCRSSVVPAVQIKQEKMSIPPEPMEDAILPEDIVVKQEVTKDDIAMPPPAAPVPKARKAVLKEKVEAVPQEESGRRRTRTRKQTDTLPAPPVPSRTTRASSRNTQVVEPEEVPVTKDARPKRTRGRKKVSEVTSDTEKETHVTQDSGLGSPSDKPRPKRTRKGQKTAEKETKIVQEKEKEITKDEVISPKEEAEILSPIIESYISNFNAKAIEVKLQDETDARKDKIHLDDEDMKTKGDDTQKSDVNTMDCTVVLHNGVRDDTRKVLTVMDETIVIKKHSNDTTSDKPTVTMDTTVVLDKPTLPMDTTVVLDKTRNIAMDATVVLERLVIEPNVTEDNSLLTDDSDTPEDVTPTKSIPNKQPLSAVKEKVQKFEELAARSTRTKTRAMAKKDDVTENVTPPDKMSKVILSAENLSKMNSLIFNGKTTQVTSSATKPKSNIPTYKSTSSSTSKLSGLSKAREAAEEYHRTEKEDARRKKEALLEAKREAQKKKREEKMAAAAAAREQAERERRAALEAAARGRQEKQAHADQGKVDRMREVERKKQEQARKLAEAEERRKAEEQARAFKLIEEQKRAEATRKKQIEEAEAMKKEEAQMVKEVLQRQKEYNDKQKLKFNNRMTPIKYTSPSALDPVYMADGFQYLNSDEDEDEDDVDKKRPTPLWSTYSERRRQLGVQARLEEAGGAAEVERLFSVRPHCPDLRQIFPNIDRARLKRTSSAVWRTPPSANRYKT